MIDHQRNLAAALRRVGQARGAAEKAHALLRVSDAARAWARDLGAEVPEPEPVVIHEVPDLPDVPADEVFSRRQVIERRRNERFVELWQADVPILKIAQEMGFQGEYVESVVRRKATKLRKQGYELKSRRGRPRLNRSDPLAPPKRIE